MSLNPVRVIRLKKIKVGDFKAISTLSFIEVIYTPYNGPTQVQIQAPANILPYIDVHVDSNGKLIVGMKRHQNIHFSGNQKSKVYVKARPVRELNTLSSGNIILTNDLKVQGDVNFSTSSSGNIDGRLLDCNTLHAKTLSSGNIQFDRMVCKQADVCTQSSGDIIIDKFTCNRISAQVQSSGDIRIKDLTAKKVTAKTLSSGNVCLSGNCRVADYQSLSSGDVKAADLKADTVYAQTA
ncbi:MAG: DUF2807 domain-containing protein [Paraprevotella sp.]|nr:DUF2807 domain-containing protein [Paraprevotella sp.]